MAVSFPVNCFWTHSSTSRNSSIVAVIPSTNHLLHEILLCKLTRTVIVVWSGRVSDIPLLECFRISMTGANSPKPFTVSIAVIRNFVLAFPIFAARYWFTGTYKWVNGALACRPKLIEYPSQCMFKFLECLWVLMILSKPLYLSYFSTTVFQPFTRPLHSLLSSTNPLSTPPPHFNSPLLHKIKHFFK